MNDHLARNFFGCLAFVVAIIVIIAVLSPYVPDEKEAIANVILGNVLGWPMMVLAYHYGTNAGSARKTELLGETKEVKVTNDEAHPVPTTTPGDNSDGPL